MADGYGLALAFDTDNEDFVRGVEVGRLWEQLKNEPRKIIATVHTSNTEMIMRIGEAVDRTVRCDIHDETWMTVTFAEEGT